MSILAWIVVGFIAGALAQWVTRTPAKGCLATIVVGVLGGLIGGALWRLATDEEGSVFDDFDAGSVLVAFVGAVLLLLVLEALRPRGRR
jgi:uncharacterized membrane protein YeaQ/YmgE (transglycosylase-associated protein family)